MAGSVFKSALGLLSGRLCHPLFSFLLFWISARVLSLAEFGLYILLMGLVFIFQAISTLGLGQILTREIGRRPESTGLLAAAALVLMLPAALAGYALLYSSARVLQGAEAARLCLMLGLALPLSGVIQIAESVFTAHGSGKPIFLLNFTEQAARTGLSAVALFAGYGLAGLLWCYVAGRLVALGVSLLFLVKTAKRFPPRVETATLRLLLGYLPVFAFMTIMATLYFRADILVLSFLASEEDLGIYGCAMRLVSTCFLVPESIALAFYPRFSNLWTAKDDTMADKVVESVQLSFALCLAGAACLALFAVGGLETVFGAKYAPAAPVLVILAFMLPAHAFNVHLGLLLQAGGREKQALILILLGLVLVFVCMTFGVYNAGVMGAAMGIVAATWGIALAHLRATQPLFFALSRRSPVYTAMVLLAACVAAVALIQPQSLFSLALAGFVAALVPLAASGLFQYATPAKIKDTLR